jgi:KaiC/GvpD/RAD55 family RecA-like ATPase
VAGSTKRSTGIAGLDLALDGGFPAGARIVISGSPLSGLEILARQFWQEGGRAGAYLMLDALPADEMVDARGMSLEEMVAAMTGERNIVDSLSTLVATLGIEAAIRLVVEDTSALIGEGSTIVYLLYTNLHTPSEETRIMRAADIFITLRQEIHGNEVERTLAIEKFRDGDVPRRVIPYNIMAEGIEVSTTSRVF